MSLMKTITTLEMTCCDCGTIFAMDETLKELREKDGETFFCPNGHGQHFTQSPASKLEEANGKIEELTTDLRDAKTEITRLRCALLRPQRPWWKRWSSSNKSI